jgi:hypothetical protein
MHNLKPLLTGCPGLATIPLGGPAALSPAPAKIFSQNRLR